MKKTFAARLDDIEAFRVVEVLTRAKALEAAGRDIVHLEAGEPDFTTAEPIIKAAQKALSDGHTYYSQAAGLPALREAVAHYYETDYGLNIDPGRVIITPGASGALLLIASLLINPGDGMLMADPSYPCNRHFLRLVEGHAQLLPVGPEHRFQLDADRVNAHWQSNTRGVMVASPSNPTGDVLDKEQLQGLVNVCNERQGYLVVDEIYHGLTYDGAVPSVLEFSDDAFVVNSFSKYFGMTGWRLGWLVAPEAAVAELEKLAQNLFISMSTMAQYGALAAFQPDTRRILDARRDEYAKRRDVLLPELRALGFKIPSTPGGAFYLYADVGHLTDNCEAFCMDLLERHGVAITPGTDFGEHRASEHVRFAYTTGIQRLEEAIIRLQRVLG